MKNLLLFSTFFLAFITGNAQTLLDTALNFTVKDVYGNSLELYSFLNDDKIVVIDFFSSSWGTCQAYAPEVQASNMDFGDNQGNVIFMGISKGDYNKDVIAYDQTYGITYPSASGFEGNGNQVHLAYLTQSTPTVIVIQPNRFIHNQGIWPPTQENITAAVIEAGGFLVGIDDKRQDLDREFYIFPNPATDEVAVTFKNHHNASMSIEIINQLGEKVYKTMVNGNTGTISLKLPIDHLSSGLYYTRLIEDNKIIETKKLIVK